MTSCYLLLELADITETFQHSQACMQVRVCTRMGVQLVSTDFKSPDYYSNIRKAITAGYFMQARPGSNDHFQAFAQRAASECVCWFTRCLTCDSWV